MSEHLSSQDLQRYHERALPPTVLTKSNEHLASCARCHKQYTELYHLPDNLSPIAVDVSSIADEEPFHLLFEEEIVAYVDGHLDEAGREIVESHIETCGRCSRDIRELVEFRAELEVSTKEEQMPLATRPRRWNLISERRKRPNLGRAAAAAAILTAVILIALILLSPKGTDDKTRLQEREADNTSPNPENNPKPTDLPPPETPAIVSLVDGDRRVMLDGQHKLEGLEALPASLQQAIEAALADGVIARPQILAELAGEPSLLLGAPGKGVPFGLLSPVGAVVLDDRPTFRWRPLNGAAGYTVSVFNAAFEPVATSKMVQTAEWRISRALKRGAVYSWQVTALVDGREVTSPVKPAPFVQFKVIESTRVSELELIRGTYPNSHLAAGVLYGHAGLKSEAEREFRALVKDNPDSSAARRLLLSVQSWRDP